jgi:hypothetical protein
MYLPPLFLSVASSAPTSFTVSHLHGLSYLDAVCMSCVARSLYFCIQWSPGHLFSLDFIPWFAEACSHKQA